MKMAIQILQRNLLEEQRKTYETSKIEELRKYIIGND